MKKFLVNLVLWGTLCVSPALGQDLRKQYGTRSLKAASYLGEGISLVNSGKSQQALSPIAAALKADPKFQMALYWQGIALHDSGNPVGAIASYEELYQTATPEKSFIPLEGCFNAGVNLGEKGSLEESAVWLSRAVLLDPENKHKRTGRVYRNLAVTMAQASDFSSALLCAVIGKELAPDDLEQEMVDDLSKRAQSEVAKVLHLPHPKVDVAYRDDVQSETPQQLPDVTEQVGTLLDLTAKRMMLVLPQDDKYYDLVAYSHDMATKRIKTQGRPQAACYVAGKLYLSLTSPNRISEVEIVTGKELSTWELPTPAPNSIAVAPTQGVAFYCNSGLIRILDLSDGAISESRYSATAIACDPRQESVFAFRTPDYEDTSTNGHFLIRGRPIFFQVQSADFDSSQSTLFRYEIASKSLVLSEVRISAAANGRLLKVSPDGDFVALVGGGGWRPQDRTAGSGYGVPVFEARDFSRVARFVQTDAYPLTAAFNPVSRHFVARGGKTVLTHLVNDDEVIVDIDEQQQSGSDRKFASFSGDGKWLFATLGQKLHVIKIPLSGREERSNWYASLAPRKKPRKGRTTP